MLTPTLAYREVNQKAIDDELVRSYKFILYSCNQTVNASEKSFREAQQFFKESNSMKAVEYMTTNATVHDVLSELQAELNEKIRQIESKYWPKEEEDNDEAFLA